MEMALAVHTSRGLTRILHSREKQANKSRDDRDDNE